MNSNEKTSKEYYTVDLLHIAKVLWAKVWVLIVAGILAAVVGFSFAAFAVTPTYSAAVKLYVNNSLSSVSQIISASQLSAAQSLVKTYSEILKSRTTLERVLEKSGLQDVYTTQQLSSMIEAGAANNTEIMLVKVTCADPYDAALLANCIAEVLPERTGEIIDSASMTVVDSAVPNLNKVSPNIKSYTVGGLFIGVFLAAALIAILAIADDTIHDEDYILQTYDYPILAKIPNLLSPASKSSKYYSSGPSSENL